MIIKQFKFRNKLAASFLLIFIPMTFLGGGIAFFKIRQFLETGIEKELNTSITALHNIIRTAARISIQNHLSAIVRVHDFEDLVLSFKSGKSGYVFLLDQDGKILVPTADRRIRLLDQNELPWELLKEIITRKNGRIRYYGKNHGNAGAEEKMVLFRHLSEYNWIICSSGYVQEIYSPLTRLKLYFTMGLILTLGIGILLTFLVSRSMARPIENLIRKLDEDPQGNLLVRKNHDATDELGKISTHLESFMDRLDTCNRQLNHQMEKTIIAQKALVENDLKFRGLFNQSFQYTGILSPLGILEEVNQTALNFCGLAEIDVLYKPVWKTLWWSNPDDSRVEMEHAVRHAMKGHLARLEITARSGSPEMEERNFDISIKPVFNNSDEIEFLIMEGRDITNLKQAEQEKFHLLKQAEQERRRLAVQLEKSQKMEAIGTLAGGIAHDFNNILSSIFGYSQLAEMSLNKPEKVKNHIHQIMKGAQRAASLIQQILTFSRQKEFEKKPLKIYLILKEALKLLRSTIPSTIEFQMDIKSTATVMADATQMHQVIMNLCTNAYQAMSEKGGILKITLKDKRVDRQEALGLKTLYPGNYLELRVIDTGHGMDEKTLEKAFDPYFTTKDIGKGTGFGLPLVLAIVEEHEGLIHVESEPGKGSCFTIFLPEAEGDKPKTLPLESSQPRRGTETIMVVDDEESIRRLTTELLAKFGYTVYTYGDGLEALSVFEERPERFDLVITDMTMPKITGDTLCRRMLQIRKDIPTILCTGYSESISKARADEIGITRFVHKPVKNFDLLAMIRQILDQK